MNEEKKEALKDIAKMIGGVGPSILAHSACLISGAYKGSMNAHGMDVDIPFRYLWGANVLGSSVCNLTWSEKDNSALEKICIGAGIGAVAAPVEFVVTYGIGYMYGWLSNKVFN